jgi:hypothetical protein
MPLPMIVLLLFGGTAYYGHSRRKKRGEVGMFAMVLLIAVVLYVDSALR